MCSRRDLIGTLAFVAAVATAWGAQAADKKDQPAGQTVRGRIVAKTDAAVDVRAEDEKEVRRYMIAPAGAKLGGKIVEFIKGLAVGSEVEVQWRPEWGGRRALLITVLGEPGKSGRLTGTVTAKSNDADPTKPAGWLEIKDEEGNTRRYGAPYREKGPDQDILKAIDQRNVGDSLQFRWYTDDHISISTIRVLALSPDAAKRPGFEGGTAVGKVVEKGKDFVVIKPDDGEQERYVPQSIVGEKDSLDKDVLRAIGNAKVGDRVEGKWFKDGERRLYSLKAASAP